RINNSVRPQMGSRFFKISVRKDVEMEEEGKNSEEEVYAEDITKKTLVAVHRQGTTQRSRGKSLRRAIVNSRDLVQAPRKRKAVKYWITATKLSFGCLLETKVQVGSWSCLHNYTHHRLGRIWVVWSEEMEVCHVLTSAQMITVWVKYKSTGDTFLCSFIYASNCAIERRELWREIETISNTVAGSSNPWIIQGDFNVALTEQEHSLASVWNESAPLYHSRSALKFFQEKFKSLKSVLRGLNRDMFGDLPGR
ncbi:hypothetical protein HID58_081783, partial [Brassica napus]